MKVGFGWVGMGGLAAFWGLWAAPSWAMGTLYVTRAEAPVVSEPNAKSAEVGRLSLGAKLETGEKVRGFIEITFDGKKAWVRKGALGRKAPGDRSLCASGRRALSASNLTAAVIYLRAAADAGTKRRDCLQALADTYHRRSQLSDEAVIRARIRGLEQWMPGKWCDANQRLTLTLGDDGRFSYKTEIATLGAGTYDLKEDEVLLAGEGPNPYQTTLFVKKRGLGHVLITVGAVELQRDFCADVQ